MNLSSHHKSPKNMKSFLYASSAIFAVTIVGCSNSDSSSTSGNCSSSYSQPAAPSVQYSLVTVGNPGNSADITGFGAVNYAYQIGKYDVTIAQYTAFLNAVAKTDTNGLYDSNMTTDLNIAGISRSGTSGSYIYSVMNNGEIIHIIQAPINQNG